MKEESHVMIDTRYGVFNATVIPYNSDIYIISQKIILT